MSSAHRWLKLFLFGRRDAEILQTLAAEVASRCREAVEARAREKFGVMGIQQMRGYIRAQAAGIVRGEVDDLVDAGRLACEDRLLAEAWATERIIHAVIHDWFRVSSPRVASGAAA